MWYQLYGGILYIEDKELITLAYIDIIEGKIMMKKEIKVFKWNLHKVILYVALSHTRTHIQSREILESYTMSVNYCLKHSKRMEFGMRNTSDYSFIYNVLFH